MGEVELKRPRRRPSSTRCCGSQGVSVQDPAAHHQRRLQVQQVAQSDKIWSGHRRVVSCSNRCDIRLKDSATGEFFAACFMLPRQQKSAIETMLDSSRCFVLHIKDSRGKHAFVGLGFNERNEAFDFNISLSDHEKYVKRELETETTGGNESEIAIAIAIAV
uniref:NECAP PHear domain-containing protein n=1 Tax=Arundo donax TaxID=35708 RepID=A0A0A9CX72_ARUDO